MRLERALVVEAERVKEKVRPTCGVACENRGGWVVRLRWQMRGRGRQRAAASGDGRAALANSNSGIVRPSERSAPC